MTEKFLHERLWQRSAQPVFSAMTSAQTWCRVTLYNPTVVCFDGLYRMWYLYKKMSILFYRYSQYP